MEQSYTVSYVVTVDWVREFFPDSFSPPKSFPSVDAAVAYLKQHSRAQLALEGDEFYHEVHLFERDEFYRNTVFVMHGPPGADEDGRSYLGAVHVRPWITGSLEWNHQFGGQSCSM